MMCLLLVTLTGRQEQPYHLQLQLLLVGRV